jgi:hypothetical protein
MVLLPSVPFGEMSMTNLINLNEFESIEEFVKDIQNLFSDGYDKITIVSNKRVIGQIISTNLIEQELVRKITQRALTNPQLLVELENLLVKHLKSGN